MVHDTEYITFRAMQNPDEPDLPFAQSLLPTMFRDMQNPDEPDLPFAQSSRKYVYYDYIVNGDHWTFGKMVDKKVRWTENNAQQYRNKGYSVVKVEDTGGVLKPKPKPPIPPTTTGGLSKSEIEKIIESYHGDDISRLYRIHGEQEERITSKSGGFTKPQIEKIFTDYYGDDIEMLHKGHVDQQDYFDKKIEAQIKEHTGFHTKLSNLGKSVTDVSNALSVHSTHDLIPNPLGDILPYVLIGGVAYFLLRRKRK